MSATTPETRSPMESQGVMTELMMPHMANNLGNVFGGVILSLVDRVAAVAATRHARRTCVTVSFDRVNFREPIYLGELVLARSNVNFVGRTSIEVGVRVEAENLITGVVRHTNTCYVTFVAIDEHGHPVRVPGIQPETAEQRAWFAAGRARRAQRLDERRLQGNAEH